jgi:hypothetical protein
LQGSKGEKGSSSRAGTVIISDPNELPTGFIEGPPGPPGVPGLPGKKVYNYVTMLLCMRINIDSSCPLKYISRTEVNI